jgi:tellurite resistance protein
MRALTRSPPRFFAIPFGLAGLAGVWRLMAVSYGSPEAISDVLLIATAVIWTVLVLASLARVGAHPRVFYAELRDPILSPFWVVPLIVGMQLAIGLQPQADSAAKVVFVTFLCRDDPGCGLSRADPGHHPIWRRRARRGRLATA